MAKPPVTYGSGLSLKPKAEHPAATAEAPASEAQVETSPPADKPRAPRPMETKSEPTLIYLSGEGKLALKQYALGRGMKVKVHDLLIEALEDWGRKHTPQVKSWRAPSARPRKSG